MSKSTISKLDSYALMIIALSALIVSIWQVNLQRKHDRISVMPYMDWQMGQDDEGYVWLKVKNKGFGPAFIESGRIETSDSTFRDWKVALHYLDPSIKVNRHSSMGKFTLLPQEEFLLVAAKGGEKAMNINFKVKFKDAYDYEYEDNYRHNGYPFR